MMAAATTATTLMAVVVVVIMSMMAESVQADSCATHANGCSVPFGLLFFYQDTFTPSCNRHDTCYGCGAAHGFSRDDCDHAFLQDMKKACLSLTRRRLISREKRSYSGCITFATNAYYAAVHAFGESHFHGPGHTEAYCGEAWVRPCLPGSPSRRRSLH